MPRSHNYASELLDFANELQRKPEGRPGKLSTARARRSVSTAYYALFHFILEEATRSVLGAHHSLRSRRHTLARVFTHTGVNKALDKVKGSKIHLSVQELLRPRHLSTGDFPAPDFARFFAEVFAEVQVKRHEADHDLNTPIERVDARITILKAAAAVTAWQAAISSDDRDFKHALSMLMLLKGELRRDT